MYTHTNTTTRTPRECDNGVDGVFFIAVPSIPAIAVCNKMYNKKKRKILTMITYMFSPHLQLSNGKRLSLQQETRPYMSVAFH
jgi:hypothetical protein